MDKTVLNPTLRRYAAVLLFETSCLSPSYKPLYEEEIVLIEASSEEAAKRSAVEYAKQQECSYENQYKETITNSFKLLLDIQLMQSDKLSHGTTLYTRHFRDYKAYEAFEPLLAGQPL